MLEQIEMELFNRIAQLDNGNSVRVRGEIIPEVGQIDVVNHGENIIEVHAIEPEDTREGWLKVRFSITKNRNFTGIPNLELRVQNRVVADTISSVDIHQDEDLHDKVTHVYELEINQRRFEQYVLECTVLEKMEELEPVFNSEPYNVYVDSEISSRETPRTDVDHNSYTVEVHEVENVDNKYLELKICFSIAANPFTQDEMDRVETKIKELFQAYEFYELKRAERWPDEEEGTEDTGSLWVIYKMATHYEGLG